MIKPILKIILTLTLYELIKYATVQYLIYRDRNDEVEVPIDYFIHDYTYINGKDVK